MTQLYHTLLALNRAGPRPDTGYRAGTHTGRMPLRI
jgi:hypothetical protein